MDANGLGSVGGNGGSSDMRRGRTSMMFWTDDGSPPASSVGVARCASATWRNDAPVSHARWPSRGMRLLCVRTDLLRVVDWTDFEGCQNGGLTKPQTCNPHACMIFACYLCMRMWSDQTLLHRNTVSAKLKRKAVV